MEFSRKFLDALAADFCRDSADGAIPGVKRPSNGEACIAMLREKRPDTYLKICASLVPKEFIVSAEGELATYLEELNARRSAIEGESSRVTEALESKADDIRH